MEQRGLTLIETLIAMVIVGALTLMIPALGEFVRGMRGTAAMDRLQGDLAFARMTAVARGMPTVVCPLAQPSGCRNDADWTGGWITFLDPDGDRHPGTANDILHVDQTTAERLRIVSNAGRWNVRYLADGRSAGSNLTFRLCTLDGKHLLGRVVVNNAGRTRRERPSQAIPCS